MPRSVRWLVLVLLGLLVTVVVAVGVLQSSEGLRQSLLRRASAALEADSGLALEARSSRLRVASGRIELEGVELRTEDGRPVVEAERVRARLALMPLLRGRVEVGSLELERPRLDLRNLPAGGGDPAGGTGGSKLELRDLRISAGEIVGLPLSDNSRKWVTGASLEGVELRGSLLAGELEVELSKAGLRLTRPLGPPLDLTAAGSLSGPLSGPLELSELRLEGEGLTLAASGALGLAPEQPFELSFDSEVGVGLILDTLSPADRPAAGAGTISASGDLDLRRGRASLELESSPLPAELLGRWLEPAILASVDAAGTTLALDGRLELGPESLERVTGDLRLIWARGGSELLLVEARPLPTAVGQALQVPFDLSLAPELPGRRAAAGTLHLADWSLPGEARLEAGAFELEIPDLSRQLEGLRELWPTLVEDLPSAPAGSLTANAAFAGPVAAPVVDLNATWLPARGSLVGVRASGEPLALRGRVEAELTRVPLAAFDEKADGVLDGRVAVQGSPGAWSGSFDLSGGGLGVGELRDGSVLAVGTADRGSIRFSALEGEWQGHRVGVVEGPAGEPPVLVEETSAGLRLSAPALVLDGVEGSLVVEAPAAMLEGVPLLGSRIWSDADPDERRPRVLWSLPPSNLADLLGFEASRLVAASSGDLRIDLEKPALSEGSATLALLELQTEELSLGLDAEARLRLADGGLEIEAPGIAVAGSGAAVTGRLDLSPGWSWGDPPSSLITAIEARGEGRLAVEALLEQLEMQVPAAGEVDFGFELSGPVDALAGRLVADGPEASWNASESAKLSAPAFELELERGGWRIERLEARLNEEPVSGSGSGRLAGGRLEVDQLRLALAGLEWRGRASLPLAATDSEGSDRTHLEWEIPAADWHPALHLFGLLRPDDTVRAASSGWVDFSPSRPAATEGRVEVTGFEMVTGGRRAVAEGPVLVSLGGGSLTLEPLTLVAEEQRFLLSGSARLDRLWRPEQSYLDLLNDVRVSGRGTLLTSLLNPLLAGGIADGFLSVDLEATGEPTELEGRLSLRGDGASLTYVRPYETRITRPELELIFEAGEVARLDGSFLLNEGRVELEGGMSTEGVVDLEAKLEEVRYRLDYGLLTLLGGELALIRSSTGAMALTGEVTVEEGVLTRDIDLDLELLGQLLAPVDLTSTEQSPLELVALDLDLSTTEGVRVKNNVADLLVIWDPIKIRGTLAAPVLDGRLNIEPGGRIQAFGQTVRLDRSSIDFPGQPDQPATLDLATTSSSEDSSIAVLSREDPFAVDAEEGDEESERFAAAAAGLGTFYGERIASRLSEVLGGARISLQPVLIFGEADPGARLTVSQDFSPQFSLAASVDLRNAEAQTYLLDLHGLDGLPELNAQAFTTDEASQGAALRQRLELGGGGRERSLAPRVAKIRYPRIQGVSKRGLKRALGLRKGDRLESSGRFAAEVEIGEYLRSRGFSDARVDVTVSERGSSSEADPEAGGKPGRKVELEISAEPGPRAEFVFEGEKLSGPLRRLVTSLYRADYYEETALQEMSVEAVRGLRSLGFLEPSVEVSVAPRSPELPDGDRIVTVSMIGGRRIGLESVVFEPLPAEEAAVLAVRFSRPVQRVELAAGLAAADRRVEATLRYLGYERPTVEHRELSEDGSVLRIEVGVGERPRIAKLELGGVEEDESTELLGLTGLETGAPVRPDRIARAALLMREELRRRGYADSTVETRVGAVIDDGSERADVHFDVSTGPRLWLGEVRFEGMRATRPGWAAAVAELETESDFSMEEILDARSRLWRTGLFKAVVPEIDRAPAGDVRVGFDLRERSRFQVAYGVSWDSDDDASALVEVIDRNALGRGWTGGLRAQAASDDQSLRAFGGLPRLFNARSSLEVFALAREETDLGLITETLEGTVQLSYALRRRLTARLYGQYKNTRVREEVPSDFFPIDVELLRPLLGTQLLYDSRSGDQLAPRGLLATGDLSVSDDFIGSDFSYARFFGQVNSYRRVGRLLDRPMTWAQSVRVGFAEAFDQELVRQDRFFAGGAFSVRGYGTESLGPQEDLVVLVRPFGGEALFVLNEELRWRITESLSGLWFVDVGNVWADRSDFGSDLATSTGFGLRALTPLGLLRLDLAHALDGRPGIDPEFKLYFGFGSTF